MTLREGDLFAGRFEVHGDEERFFHARRVARKGIAPGAGPDAGWQHYEEADLLLRGVDRRNGAAVLIEPGGDAPSAWVANLEREAAARYVSALGLPSTATILHTDHAIVYAEPPPGLPRGSLPLPDAARVALQACDLAARLHAAGIRAGQVDSMNLRVFSDPSGLRICWFVPGGLHPGWVDDEMPSPAWGSLLAFEAACSPVQWDTWQLVRFFVALLPEGAVDADPRLEPFARMAAEPKDMVLSDVASLARSLLPLAGTAVDLADMPAVSSLPSPPLDWEQVLAEGEARVAEETGKPYSHARYFALPLAAAYHTRACRSLLPGAAGDLAAALRDVERAIALDDDFLSYHTTRAVLLDSLGRRSEARRTLDEAIPKTRVERPRFAWDDAFNYVGDAERARAHATRGMIALREGAAAAAEPDLRLALSLAPTPLYAHGLGAALYALGDFAGAAEAEARSVAGEPANTRYRWALIGSLRKLGRDEEALLHAREILALEPESPAHRERFVRLFGAPVEG